MKKCGQEKWHDLIFFGGGGGGGGRETANDPNIHSRNNTQNDKHTRQIARKRPPLFPHKTGWDWRNRTTKIKIDCCTKRFLKFELIWLYNVIMHAPISEWGDAAASVNGKTH